MRELLGIDIDGPAIRKGTDYLKRHGSKVVLAQGDMEDLDRMLGLGPSIWSSPPVSSAISTNRMPPPGVHAAPPTNKVLAFAGLACTGRNNDQLDRSETSPNHEQQWIHNFEPWFRPLGRVVRSRGRRSSTICRPSISCSRFPTCSARHRILLIAYHFRQALRSAGRGWRTSPSGCLRPDGSLTS